MNCYFTCQKLSKFSKMCFTTTKETALAPFNLAHPVYYMYILYIIISNPAIGCQKPNKHVVVTRCILIAQVLYCSIILVLPLPSSRSARGNVSDITRFRQKYKNATRLKMPSVSAVSSLGSWYDRNVSINVGLQFALIKCFLHCVS